MCLAQSLALGLCCTSASPDQAHCEWGQRDPHSHRRGNRVSKGFDIYYSSGGLTATRGHQNPELSYLTLRFSLWWIIDFSSFSITLASYTQWPESLQVRESVAACFWALSLFFWDWEVFLTNSNALFPPGPWDWGVPLSDIEWHFCFRKMFPN